MDGGDSTTGDVQGVLIIFKGPETGGSAQEETMQGSVHFDGELRSGVLEYDAKRGLDMDTFIEEDAK